MFICVLLVCFLLSSQVIFCFDHGVLSLPTKGPASPPTTATPVKEPPRNDLIIGLPCQTVSLYLEIICGVLFITVVAESSALLIIYFRRRKQKVYDKKVGSSTKTDNYEEYEENSTDYETLSNDYKPVPPPLATLPRSRRVTPKFHPMPEIQRTPIQITAPHGGVSQSFERPPSQTLPLPVRRSRMPKVPRIPMLPQDTSDCILPQGARSHMLPQGSRSPMLQAVHSPMLPQGSRSPMLPQTARSPMLPQGSRSPMLPQAARSPILPPVPRIPTSSPARPQIQFRLPPPPLHDQLLPQTQSSTPEKLHQPASSPQLPSASSKHCNPKRPPAPLPKDIKSHAESIPKVARMSPRPPSEYNTDASDDEWTFESIYY